MADNTRTGYIIREYIVPGLIGTLLGSSIYYSGDQLIKQWRTASCGEDFKQTFDPTAQQFDVSGLILTFGGGSRCEYKRDLN